MFFMVEKLKAPPSVPIFTNVGEVTVQKCHWETRPLKAQKADDPSLNIKAAECSVG